jgi:hypothetical protein
MIPLDTEAEARAFRVVLFSMLMAVLWLYSAAAFAVQLQDIRSVAWRHVIATPTWRVRLRISLREATEGLAGTPFQIYSWLIS